MMVEAFGGWLQGCAQKNEDYLAFCRRLGLTDEGKLTKEEASALKDYALQKAEAIKAAHKRNRETDAKRDI